MGHKIALKKNGSIHKSLQNAVMANIILADACSHNPLMLRLCVQSYTVRGFCWAGKRARQQ